MFQRFNESTLVSKAITNLLSSTYLPLLDTVRYGDFIVENFYYVYETYIIKCIKSGYLIPRGEAMVVREDLFVKQEGMPDSIYVGSESAIYEVVDEYYFNSNKVNVDFIRSYNTLDYNTEVHSALGTYLRCYRDLYHIDMMPFYNCFSNQFCTVNLDDLSNTIDGNKKIILVPIKFNKIYTICLDSTTPIRLRSIIYNYDAQNMIKKDADTYVTSLLNENITTITSSIFTKPFTYEIHCEDVYAYGFRKYLYLEIEIAKDNDSSIVVLEGNYTATARKIISVENMDTIRSDILDYALLSRLSLMSINDRKTYAFSDRLIEFLSLHMVTSQETISENVRRAQNSIGYTTAPDVWSSELRYTLYNKYIDNYPQTFDITGYIDKDIDNIL